MTGHYLIALGSNQRHVRHGAPEAVLRAACTALDQAGIRIEQTGPIVRSAPIGPSLRRYANGVVVVKSRLDPPALLAALKRIERQFGRRARGQRWSSRVLDLDVVLWTGGCWADPELTVPHPLFRQRRFVLDPALPIAGHWRDPVSNLTLRQLAARLNRARPHLAAEPGA